MVSWQAEHEAVLKAILANDPTGAGTLMRSHVGMLSEGIADSAFCAQVGAFRAVPREPLIAERAKAPDEP
jgi:hypothetical protein